MKQERQLKITADGSPTFFLPELNEHFHSINGAMQESLHVFIDHGLKMLSGSNELKIFEMGWGTGLNAFLTYRYSRDKHAKVIYDAVEAFPLREDEYQLLDFGFEGDEERSVFLEMHKMSWLEEKAYGDYFLFRKYLSALEDLKLKKDYYDLIYYDAFAPDIQPELWDKTIFEKMSGILKRGGILVTYSAKGQVRRNMKESGFLIEKLPGPKGKREMTRAIKQ